MRTRARAAILLALWAIVPGPDADAAGACAVTTPIGAGPEEVLGLAVQSDGKIVAVGYSLQGANDDFAVVRYNPDLTLDTSFQGTGKVVTAIGTGNDRAEAVAIQPDGKIVVVGYAFMGANNDLAIARYNSNGSLDPSFDGDGKTTLNLGPSNDELFDVAIQTDGKIVVVGRTRISNDDFLVARFQSTGALDFGFASGGIQTFSLGSFDESVNAVALQSDGKIVVAGTDFDPSGDDVVVARFNTNGSFDSSFAGVGYFTNSPLLDDQAKDVAIQSDGKIVVAGDSTVTGDSDVTVMRLNVNGSVDTSFNLTGYVRTDLGSTGDLGEALQIQSDGKILVAGAGGGAGFDMWALRYDAAGVPDSSFDADGKASVGLVGSTSAYAVGIGSSGSIYVAGSTIGGMLNLDFAVGRFNSDGSSPCTEITLHPSNQGSTSNFVVQSGCLAGERWRCVNDQPGDSPMGIPVANDGSASYLQDNNVGREMFRLIDGSIPPGAVVVRVEIGAQVGKVSAPNQSLQLSYQRAGFDPIPVDGPTATAASTCCSDFTSWIVGGIAWSSTELDALEVGLVRINGSGGLRVSQLYAKVTYMLSPPKVNYRSIGTASDYSTGTVTAILGSPVVTGSGTAWRAANRGRGDRITIDAMNYTILDVDSETQLTLTSPFMGTSGPGKPHLISRQYISPVAWEACIDGGFCTFFPVSSPSLVADNRREVGVVYDDGTPYNQQLVIDGTITDAIHDITLTVNPANRHYGRANVGAVFDRQTSPGPVVYVQDDFVTIEWLEVRNGANEGISVTGQGPVNRIVLRNNLVHNVPTTGILVSSISVLEVYNNVVYNLGSTGIELGPSSGAQVYNNTVYNGSGNGISGGTSQKIRNNIAHTFTGPDFSFGSLDPSSSNNLSSDASAISASPGGGSRPNVPLANVDFVSTTPGAEDLHVQTTTAAKDVGVALSLFTNDIDDDLRPLGASWDIGADESGGGGGPAPALSSANSQSFTVGGPMLPAATITITDDTATPTITAANNLRIRIPPGFPMRFDSSQTTLSIGGPASFRVASLVAYEDSGRTVVLDVLSDFVASDQITVALLRFWSYTAPAPADNLELEVGNDDVVSATDDKTITIVPNGFATLSSDNHQVFTQFQPPAPALPFTVSEGAGTSIIPGTDIRVRIPAGFNMTWDPSGAISFGGLAAGKVTLPVIYEDSSRTLRIQVTSNFVPGDYVIVSGARFQGFTGISLVNNLLLDVGPISSDDKTIEIVAASDVLFFTATAKDQAVKLEWFQPPGGLCDNVLLLRRDDGFEPTGPFDPMALQVDFRPCTLNVKDYVDDPFPLGNGTLYTYAAFVEYSGGTYTNGAFVKARPMDTVGTPVQWAYSTAATAMAPPGLRFSGGSSYVYAVSNDSILHSMNGGSGDWPAGWKPYKLGGPAQARPPVVSFLVGAATSGAAFLGSQDGNVYAVDALDGSEEWKQSISTMVQAAPAGHFLAFYPGAFDIVIVGTRDSSSPNELVALDVHTGNPVWSFDNSPAQLGDGKEIGIISGSASIDYPMKRALFASHTRGGAMGSNGTLWCVDFSSGSPMLRWSLALGDIEGSPVLWSNTVYVGTVAGRLYAVDRYAATGIVNWFHSIGNGQIKGFPFPQAGSNRVLVSTMGKVTSFEDLGLTYNIAWQLTSGDIPGPSTPVFVPGTGKVLVGSSDGYLYQFDAFAPLPTTRVQLGDGSSAVGVPTVDVLNSMIYVGSDEGVIYGVTFPIP